MMDDLVDEYIKTPIPPANTPESEPPKEPYISVDFASLQRKNSDIIGWLYCPDTVNNYPVVRSHDNKDYERHTIYHKYNANGTLFVDCNNEPDFTEFNTLIYGHRMRSGAMFGSVPKYTKQSYYDKHPVWYLLTPQTNYRVELLASFTVPVNFYVYSMISTPDALSDYLADALHRSTFKTAFTPEEGRRLITFSTCGKNAETKRLLLVGQLVELEEGETDE